MATNMKRKKKAEVMEDDGSMTLTGHLKELRNRLIICAVVFVVGVVVSLAYADRLIDLLTAMGRDYYQFVSIAPQEKLMQYFRVSILAGVVVTVLLQHLRLCKAGPEKERELFLQDGHAAGPGIVLRGRAVCLQAHDALYAAVPQHGHRGR